MKERENDKVCGNCRFNKWSDEGYCCDNPDSDRYTEHTYYRDTCEEWSERQ